VVVEEPSAGGAAHRARELGEIDRVDGAPSTAVPLCPGFRGGHDREEVEVAFEVVDPDERLELLQAALVGGIESGIPAGVDGIGHRELVIDLVVVRFAARHCQDVGDDLRLEILVVEAVANSKLEYRGSTVATRGGDEAKGEQDGNKGVTPCVSL